MIWKYARLPRSYWLAATMVALAAVSACADVSWDAVKQKVNSAKSYEVTYKYEGPRGTFKFNYRCVVSNQYAKIRTEFLESSDASKRGIVVLYNGERDKDKVTAIVGGGAIPRKTSHKEIHGTPFYQPLFALILHQVADAGTPIRSVEAGRTRFSFKTGSGTYSVWANDSGDVVRTERNDGHEKETREISNIRWDCNPLTDL